MEKFSDRHLKIVFLFTWLAGIANEFPSLHFHSSPENDGGFFHRHFELQSYSEYLEIRLSSRQIWHFVPRANLLILWSKVDLIFAESSILCLTALICTLFHQFCTFLSFFIIERLIFGISVIWNKTAHMLLYIRFPKVFNPAVN